MTRTPADPTELSVAAAALRAGVSERTIRRLISSGELPAHRFGPKLIRISVADLDALVRPLIAPASR